MWIGRKHDNNACRSVLAGGLDGALRNQQDAKLSERPARKIAKWPACTSR